jgi:hypothetical protein
VAGVTFTLTGIRLILVIFRIVLEMTMEAGAVFAIGRR